MKGTTRKVVSLKPISFKAVLSLSIQPLISGNFTENLMTMYIVQILSLPALVYQIEMNVNDSMQMFHTHNMLERSLELLEKEQNMKIITNSLKGCQTLALLANLIHLFDLESIKSIETATKLGFPSFTVICYCRCPMSNGFSNFVVPFSLFVWSYCLVYPVMLDKKAEHSHSGMIY